MNVLIIADVPGWAYDRRALALQNFAPDAVNVDVVYIANGTPTYRQADYSKCDIVFLLDYSSAESITTFLKRIGYNGPLVVGYNRDSKAQRWGPMRRFLRANRKGFVIINNLDRFETLGRLPRTCNISNGVDLNCWYSDTPVEQRELHALWCGSANPKKGKGWDEVLVPLRAEIRNRGLVESFRPFHDNIPLSQWAFPVKKQREWYNRGIVYVSTSESEGTPNTILEAMACSCIPVCTNVGNIREMGVHEHNCVIVERNVESVMDGIAYALTNMKRLSQAASQTMWHWCYGFPGNRAKCFFDLFERLVNDGVESVEPFSYMD